MAFGDDAGSEPQDIEIIDKFDIKILNAKDRNFGYPV